MSAGIHEIRVMKGKHTLMLLVTRTGPEVTNLLGLDITRGKRRTLKRRSRDLQNRQRRSIVRQDLSDTRDAGDQRRKGEALAQRNQGYQRCNSRLHFDSSFLKNRLDLVSIFERVFPGLYRRPMPPSLAVSEQILISFHFAFSPFHLSPQLGAISQARKTGKFSLVLHKTLLYHKGDFELENCDNNGQEPELFPYQALKDAKLFQMSALDAEPRPAKVDEMS